MYISVHCASDTPGKTSRVSSKDLEIGPAFICGSDKKFLEIEIRATDNKGYHRKAKICVSPEELIKIIDAAKHYNILDIKTDIVVT